MVKFEYPKNSAGTDQAQMPAISKEGYLQITVSKLLSYSVMADHLAQKEVCQRE